MISGAPYLPQVCEHLLRATMLPFQRLCSLVGGQSQATPLLEAVEGCGVLVQGCWVVGSEALYPGKGGSAQGNVRDYIVSTNVKCVGDILRLTVCSPTCSCGASHRAE